MKLQISSNNTPLAAKQGLPDLNIEALNIITLRLLVGKVVGDLIIELNV
jgi:hypothetical protein